MRKVVIAACLLILCVANNAQICNGVKLDTMRGKWKMLPPALLSTESKADLLHEKLLMDGVTEIIRKNISGMPIGGDIKYGQHGVDDDHRPGPVIKISNTYYTDIDYYQFHCYEGKINGDGLYGDADIFTTYFNDLPFTFDHSFYISGPNATELNKDPHKEVYAILKWLPEVKEGYFDYINDRVDGTGNNPGKISRWRTLIKSGKLPYIVMSKKEFYEKWKIQRMIEKEDEEAQKAKMSKELIGNPYLKQGLESINQSIAVTQNYMNKIEEILKNKTAEELSKPAYEGEQYGDYFESMEASEYRAYIVKPNYAYYNVTLNNKYSPQVISLCFEYYMDKDALGNKKYSCAKFYKALDDMKIFDLLTEKLKPLIVL